MIFELFLLVFFFCQLVFVLKQNVLIFCLFVFELIGLLFIFLFLYSFIFDYLMFYFFFFIIVIIVFESIVGLTLFLIMLRYYYNDFLLLKFIFQC